MHLDGLTAGDCSEIMWGLLYDFSLPIVTSSECVVAMGELEVGVLVCTCLNSIRTAHSDLIKGLLIISMIS